MWFFLLLEPPACLPLEPEKKEKEKKKEKKEEKKKINWAEEKFSRDLCHGFFCLLAFAISTRLPTDTEKQMLSIRLSQAFISVFVEQSLCFVEQSLCPCKVYTYVFVTVSFWAAL